MGEQIKEFDFYKLPLVTTVLELKRLPTDDLKVAVAEFFLNKLWFHITGTTGRSREIMLYCIVDEAHRLAYEGSPADMLLREARKYGVGVILASQRPSDFHETVLANAGSVLAFQHRSDRDAKAIARELNIDPNEIKNLVEAGSAFVGFPSEASARKVRIKEFNERLSEDDREKMKANEEAYVDGLHG